jgi:hypothetical protein
VTYIVVSYEASCNAVIVEGLSLRDAASRFGWDPRTIRKLCEFSAPSGYRHRAVHAGSKHKDMRPLNPINAMLYYALAVRRTSLRTKDIADGNDPMLCVLRDQRR